MQMNSNDDGVHYIVTDPQGRRSGVDPRGAKTRNDWKWLREIPHANYSFQSVGNLDPKGTSDISMEFVQNLNSPETDGLFRIEVIGNRLGKFDLFIDIAAYDSAVAQNVNFHAQAIPIEKDSCVTFFLTYFGQPGSPTGLVKYVSTASIIQDIDAMAKLTWISDQRTKEKYASIAETFGQNLGASLYRDAFDDLVLLLMGLSEDSAKTLNVNACNVLRPDLLQLLSNLPSGAQILDSLTTFVDRSVQNGWLGDNGFAGELKNGLKNAMKHFENSNIINCEKELSQVQSKVEKESSKKNTPGPGRFVIEAGRKLLTGNIQYVLDRLAEGGTTRKK